MSDWTYEFPDKNVFLYNLRYYFQEIQEENIANLLTNVEIGFNTWGSYGHRAHSYLAQIILYVKVGKLRVFTEEIKEKIANAADLLIPEEAGYDIESCYIKALLEKPVEKEEQGLNVAAVGSSGTIDYDGLHFRSKTETKIYDALKKRKVLFFPVPAAVFGGKSIHHKEPDFLICQDGKWGILEVMGEPFHPAETAMKDHDRARLFKDYGLFLVEFYPAERCYREPEIVVSEFLTLLTKQRT